jgi:predicted dehydrogenase
MLRWGILGTGAVAGRVYVPALHACGHDLAVVGSRALLRAQSFAAGHGVRRARGSYDEVLAADDVDAVLLALPQDLHEPWAIAALEAGKHVLCPRPLALDGPAAGRMAAASAQHGKVLVEGLPALAHPRFEALLEAVRAGAAGEVRLVHATTSARVTDPRSFRAQAAHGGGALLDLGVEAVTAARRLAGGEPTAVRGLQRRWSTGIDGTTAALLSFPSAAVAALTMTFDAVAHDRLEVVGSEAVFVAPGAFSAGRGDQTVLLRDGEVYGTWRADPAEAVVEAFTAAAAGGSRTGGIDDAVATAEVLDRVRVAAN